MSTNLPYILTPGVLPKILNKICEAAVPESFNSDFLGTKLGFPGGSQRMFISWAKKCTFLNSDGTPTQLYKDFRNPNYKGISMAEALKKVTLRFMFAMSTHKTYQEQNLLKLSQK